MATCNKCGKQYMTRECLNCKKKEFNSGMVENIHINRNRVNKKNENYSNKKHANFLIRFLAVLIDTIIISLPIALIFGDYITDGIIGIITISLWIFWNGQTPGKKILNLKIVDENYSDINLKTAIIRYVGYYINILTFLIGFAIISFREDRRGLHDILAKTYVVHTDKERTNFESDTADKIFSIMSIFVGIFVIISLTIKYQQTKELNEILYGTNNANIIEQKHKKMTQQNKEMINEMNKANKQLTNMFKKINQDIK